MSDTDGRRLRGHERRRRLIDAALVVLERDGLAGFSHRAVAAQAGVALASATYHFRGIDDLAVSTILAATDDFTRVLAGLPDGAGVAGYATGLAEELSNHRGRVVAGYELYLLAARRPALREAATAWLRAGTQPVLAGVDEMRCEEFLAVVSSSCLQALLADEPPDASRIEARLRYSLRDPA